MNQKSAFVIALSILLLLFAGGSYLYMAERDKEATAKAEANRAILQRDHAPTLGRADAPVTVVEFLDPACETCKAFYPRVKELMAAHPDKIRLVIRYAPFHPGSDKIVAVLEAARRQDKFWPALEALLATQAEWAPHHRPQLSLIWKPLGAIGLNLEQLAFDMTAPEITARIEQDLADARAMNVSKTPEFFVNGKALPSFGYEQLKHAVNEAVLQSRERLGQKP